MVSFCPCSHQAQCQQPRHRQSLGWVFSHRSLGKHELLQGSVSAPAFPQGWSLLNAKRLILTLLTQPQHGGSAAGSSSSSHLSHLPGHHWSKPQALGNTQSTTTCNARAHTGTVPKCPSPIPEHSRYQVGEQKLLPPLACRALAQFLVPAVGKALTSLPKVIQSTDAAPIHLSGTQENRIQGKQCQGLSQAAVGDQEQTPGRHDWGQAWLSSSHPPCAWCHNIYWRHCRGPGTGWGLDSPEAAGSSGAPGLQHRAASMCALGGGWNHTEQGPRVPSSTGCSCPFTASLPAASPTHPSAATHAILPSSHPTCPKAPQEPPGFPQSGSTGGFPGSCPAVPSAHFQRLHVGPFQVRVFSDSMTAGSPEGTSVLHPIIPTQRLWLRAEMHIQMEWD